MTETQSIIVYGLITIICIIQLLVDIDYIATRIFLRRMNTELAAMLQAIKKPAG